MTRLARLNSVGMTFAIAAITLAACSSGQGDEVETGVTHEGIYCESIVCNPLPKPPVKPVPAPPLACVSDYTCWAWPSPNEGYSTPFVRVGGAATISNLDFSDQMTAAGCGPEFLYITDIPPDVYTNGNEYFHPMSAALCPTLVSGAAAFTLPRGCGCGAPPRGWKLVTWMGYDPDAQPGSPCHAKNCLLNSGEPIPTAPTHASAPESANHVTLDSAP